MRVSRIPSIALSVLSKRSHRPAWRAVVVLLVTGWKAKGASSVVLTVHTARASQRRGTEWKTSIQHRASCDLCKLATGSARAGVLSFGLSLKSSIASSTAVLRARFSVAPAGRGVVCSVKRPYVSFCGFCLRA